MQGAPGLLGPRQQRAVGLALAGRAARDIVRLVEPEDDLPQGSALVHLAQQFGNVDVLVGGRHGAIHQPEHDVGVGKGLLRHVDHVLAQFVQRAVDAGRVEEEDLRVGLGDDAEDLVARGLRLGRDDGEFLPQQPVEQRGFARVGAADHGHVAAAVVGGEITLVGRKEVGIHGDGSRY